MFVYNCVCPFKRPAVSPTDCLTVCLSDSLSVRLSVSPTVCPFDIDFISKYVLILIYHSNIFVDIYLETVRDEKSRNFAQIGRPLTSSYWKRTFRTSRAPWTWLSTKSNCHTRCQFHQRFTSSFFERKSFEQLFLYSLGLYFFGERTLAQKLRVKCCWNWLKPNLSHSAHLYIYCSKTLWKHAVVQSMHAKIECGNSANEMTFCTFKLSFSKILPTC